MIKNKITTIPTDEFLKRIQGKRVVLLYPWTGYRNLFLAYHMEHSADTLLYHRVREEDNSFTQFIQTLLDELNDLLGSFGENTQAALDGGDAGEIGMALAQELDELDNFDTFFLDELDRVPLSRSFRKFLDVFVSHIPDGLQLVVNSRLLTYNPWIELVENGEAAVFGTEFRKDNLMFTVSDERKPQLEIYSFGPGHAVVNGREIETWDGALPRNLFFFFIDNELVTRDQIFEVFWPDLSVKEATNVFHVTKRKITEKISNQVFKRGNYELTQYGNGFYTPSTKVVRHYDVADFEAAVDEASMTFDDEKQEALYRRAVETYKAPLLQTIDMPWVIDRREKLHRKYGDALIGLARIYKARDAHETALGYFARSLHEMPTREDIHREIMQLYYKIGRPKYAIEQYQLLENLLQSTLQVSPSRETRTLYQKIEGGEAI